LDVLWIGRVDLSVSSGIPGKLDDPKIQDAVKRIIAEGSAAGKVVGVGAVNSNRPDQIKEFIDQGARFFSLDTTAILRSAARNILQSIEAE
ncbi:MAG: aldolase, partial [Dehalococcoidia bacterium]|nr:aldolase [Dehalococcoidia bacterium]